MLLSQWIYFKCFQELRDELGAEQAVCYGLFAANPELWSIVCLQLSVRKSRRGQAPKALSLSVGNQMLLVSESVSQVSQLAWQSVSCNSVRGQRSTSCWQTSLICCSVITRELNCTRTPAHTHNRRLLFLESGLFDLHPLYFLQSITASTVLRRSTAKDVELTTQSLNLDHLRKNNYYLSPIMIGQLKFMSLSYSVYDWSLQTLIGFRQLNFKSHR